jgi:hypothetical protein
MPLDPMREIDDANPRGRPSGGAKLIAFASTDGFVAMARVASIVGVALAGLASWVFMELRDDVKTAIKSGQESRERIVAIETDAKSTKKRVDRLEDRVFSDGRRSALDEVEPRL